MQNFHRGGRGSALLSPLLAFVSLSTDSRYRQLDWVEVEVTLNSYIFNCSYFLIVHGPQTKYVALGISLAQNRDTWDVWSPCSDPQLYFLTQNTSHMLKSSEQNLVIADTNPVPCSETQIGHGFPIGRQRDTRREHSILYSAIPPAVCQEAMAQTRCEQGVTLG